jgi:4-hydroxyphenylpyruvate dioxygenase
MPTTSQKQSINSRTDFLPLLGTDYVEFYVGNAKQAAHFYISAFGFSPLAYAGPETGQKHIASYAVRQNKLTIVLTTSLHPDNEIADHVYKHGDGVKTLALLVNDAADAWHQTTSRAQRNQNLWGHSACVCEQAKL